MSGPPRNTVTVLRSPTSQSANEMETDALNGIGTIPGVIDVEIESADSDSVTLSYTWTGTADFQATDEHLAKYGLRKRWKNEA
ncbi:MAG: hypothetical protein IPP91_01510 [Betaproteobacteria bacterium]|nr:hypothetical protein [Betaproteobacteria bacterium]